MVAIYVTVEWATDSEEDVEIECDCEGFQPFVKGNRRGHPDTWEPDEGGYVEDVTYTLDGREISEAQFIRLGGDPKKAERALFAEMERDDRDDCRDDDY
jgi:hypothetical protein